MVFIRGLWNAHIDYSQVIPFSFKDKADFKKKSRSNLAVYLTCTARMFRTNYRKQLGLWLLSCKIVPGKDYAPPFSCDIRPGGDRGQNIPKRSLPLQIDEYVYETTVHEKL